MVLRRLSELCVCRLDHSWWFLPLGASKRRPMAAHLNRTAALAVALGLLSVPATVDALPIHFRIQTSESTLDLRDDASGARDAAGAGGSAGLVSNSMRDAGLGGGGFGGAGGGSLGQGSGGGSSRSTPRARGTASTTRWIRGSGGSGFRNGSAWNDSGLLLIATLPAVMETNGPPPPINGKIPEPVTAILFGSAVAFLSLRRLSRHL